MQKLPLIALVLLIGSGASQSQSFINLGFESAVVQPTDSTYGWLNWGLAAPGWSHSSGDGTSIIYYMNGHLGTPQIFMLKDANSPVWAPGTQLAGNYSLAFASGYFHGATMTDWTSAYISQSGEIPVSARSIWMLLTGPFEVQLNGNPLAMNSMGGNLYAADITAYAGSFAELKIRNTSAIGWVHEYTTVDNILFSPTVVPEPRFSLLHVVGALTALTLRRSKRAGSI